MPNTLAHLGLQLPLGRALFRRLDSRWLFLACVLPDLPWIAQRLLRVVVPPEAWASLRFYFTVQGSLLLSLILAAALALPARHAARVFGVLALGSLVHLLLDALQIKWGNGVLLLAPLVWPVWSLDLFWPESLPTLLITLAGLPAAVLLWRWQGPPTAPLYRMQPGRAVLSLLLLAAYVGLPLLCIDRVQVGGLDAVALAGRSIDRAGRPVAFDRDRWNPETGTLLIFTGENLVLRSALALPTQAAIVSVQGVLAADGSLEVQALHVHPRGYRDLAAVTGLILVAGVWLAPLLSRRKLDRKDGKEGRAPAAG